MIDNRGGVKWNGEGGPFRKALSLKVKHVAGAGTRKGEAGKEIVHLSR